MSRKTAGGCSSRTSMTRSPAEARFAARRSDPTILWGYGAHPGVASAVTAVEVLHPDVVLLDVLLPDATGFRERGVASWYGPTFHAKSTSIGETYDMYAMSAAHKTLPLPAYARVTNLACSTCSPSWCCRRPSPTCSVLHSERCGRRPAASPPRRTCRKSAV